LRADDVAQYASEKMEVGIFPMDRRQFLEGRIKALKSSISHHQSIMDLYQRRPSVAVEGDAEMAEQLRRIEIDQSLLERREAELKELG
jgi:hypothetical protein